MDNYADIIIKNASIYTSDENMPWADAVAIKNGKFMCVGSYESFGVDRIAPNTRVIDLEGRFVLPGLIDGHTHPETITLTSWMVKIPDTESIEELLGFVKDYCNKHSAIELPYFYGEAYPVKWFGEKGPNKELLDAYVSDRPVRIQDSTDHGSWVNSKALELMGVNKGTPDCKPTEFVRDEAGEPTGWIKEPIALGSFEQTMFDKLKWSPPMTITGETVKPFLDYLNSYGVTAIFDGLTEDEEAIKVFHEMDLTGTLKMQYSGTCLLESYEDLDLCIRRLKDWKRKYKSSHVDINTVKFFMDGTNEIGTSSLLEPFSNEPSRVEYKNTNMSVSQMTDVLVKLNSEGLDFHVHVVGDRGFRMCCDAVEDAKKICRSKKQQWKSIVELAHCELVDPADMERPAKLGILINWSPHWTGGYFGTSAREWLGEERFNRLYDFRKMIKSGAIVTYSSDVLSYGEYERANPFLGMACAVSRTDHQCPLDGLEGKIKEPSEATFTVKELIKGYTIQGAMPLRLSDRIGSIQAGKDANLVVLNENIFDVSNEHLHKIKPEKVMFEGEFLS